MAKHLRRREDVARFSDPPLRVRVGKSVADFQHCFDTAIAHPSQEALDELRKATDQLMRSGARVLLELSRG